ncbi:tyrosine-protein phosphatase [Myxococcota bacterium]|nr:tyrosine-protein phosphatase [Myxococcota bacterium]
MLERRLDLRGCNNFRDLGGYPTRDGRRVGWRLLFRADGLSHLTPEDVAYLRDEIELGDIIDLRSTRELEIDGRGLLEQESIRFHHLPLFDGNAPVPDKAPAELSLGEMYLGMTEFAKLAIARIVETLASSERAAVYHCAAGKDRTGVISAILLGILGVEDEVIVADYAATRETLDAIVERLNESGGYRDMWKELPPETLHANPETMVALLDGLRERHGSMDAYALSAGVNESSLVALRERVLE